MNLKTLALVAAFAAIPAIASAQTADPKPKTTSGPECAKGCPTSTGAAGLSPVEFLALQQELRDRGCGNNRVPGVLDAATRAAIRNCAKRLNVAATPRAVLNAMNIGYTVPEPAQ